MTLISVLLMGVAYMVFIVMCSSVMSCIRGKQLNCPFDEWKGSLFMFLFCIILLLGCLIGSWFTSVRCPQCHAVAIWHYCEDCDINIKQHQTICSSCENELDSGFCVTCGTLQE